MLAGYANKEPDFIEAGTTVLFERHLPDYPASQNWFCSYSIIGLGQTVTFTSVADGDSHANNIPAATTALWLPADGAKLTGFVINSVSGQTFRFYSQSCPILPNLVNPPPDQPSLTFNQKVIIALEALYLTKGCDDILLARVGDSEFKFESKKQIWEALCMARAERRVEVAKERARNGKPSETRITPRISITPPGPIYGPQYPFGFVGGG